MSLPRISIRPDVGSISRLIIRSVVVLPHPDGPISATIDPSSISRLNEDTAGVAVPSNCLRTLSSLIATEPMGASFRRCACQSALRFRPHHFRPGPAELTPSVGRRCPQLTPPVHDGSVRSARPPNRGRGPRNSGPPTLDSCFQAERSLATLGMLMRRMARTPDPLTARRKQGVSLTWGNVQHVPLNWACVARQLASLCTVFHSLADFSRTCEDQRRDLGPLNRRADTLRRRKTFAARGCIVAKPGGCLSPSCAFRLGMESRSVRVMGASVHRGSARRCRVNVVCSGWRLTSRPPLQP